MPAAASSSRSHARAIARTQASIASVEFVMMVA